jgi:hypothetical protein
MLGTSSLRRLRQFAWHGQLVMAARGRAIWEETGLLLKWVVVAMGRIEQEKEILEKSNSWLNEELTRKSEAFSAGMPPARCSLATQLVRHVGPPACVVVTNARRSTGEAHLHASLPSCHTTYVVVFTGEGALRRCAMGRCSFRQEGAGRSITNRAAAMLARLRAWLLQADAACLCAPAWCAERRKSHDALLDLQRRLSDAEASVAQLQAERQRLQDKCQQQAKAAEVSWQARLPLAIKG